LDEDKRRIKWFVEGKREQWQRAEQLLKRVTWETKMEKKKKKKHG
jgi:hypothetical protein